MDRPVHIVGGGIAGLIAAITVAEAGAPVVVHEVADRLGGRALGGTDRPGINLGPHAVFSDGALVRWARAHEVGVGLRGPMLRGLRVLDDGGSHVPVRQAIQLATTLVPREAPVDESFATWAERTFGSGRAVLMSRLAGLFTYHHDPGMLSAKFVWDRYRRTFLSPDRVRWIAGGWSTLVDALAERATALGVHVELQDRVTPQTLPDAPTVIATKLSAASRVLERPLHWPGARTALVDVVAEPSRGWPNAVADVRSDLETCCMLERETAIDRGLLGSEDAELIQAHLGIAPDVGARAGVERIEDGLDRAFGGWREGVLWRRGHVVVDSTGAVDPPGATWHDRPAVDQGDDVYLAGDAVAAPGLLSEVAVNSGVQAARLALDARRRRTFAPGWPSAHLTPERRFAVLAAVVPGASLDTAVVTDGGDRRWEIAPVDETGPGYRLHARGRVLRGMAVTASPGGVRVTTLGSSRWPEPAASVLRLFARRRFRLGRPRRR